MRPNLSEAEDARTFVAEPVRSAPAVVPMTVRRSICLVTELTLAGEHHRDVVLVCGGNHFVIAHRSSGLNDRPNARLGRLFYAVTKREERIGAEHCAFGAVSGETSLVNGQKRSVDA